MFAQIWDWITKNRWTVIVPAVAVALWVFASLSCVPTTPSPTRPGVLVSAEELQLDFQVWLNDCNSVARRFEFGRADIARQVEQWSELEAALMTLASGNVTTWAGLLQLLLGSGVVGLFADNIRKNGVIGGLKRNK
jgi:hypothetical protein